MVTTVLGIVFILYSFFFLNMNIRLYNEYKTNIVSTYVPCRRVRSMYSCSGKKNEHEHSLFWQKHEYPNMIRTWTLSLYSTAVRTHAPWVVPRDDVQFTEQVGHHAPGVCPDMRARKTPSTPLHVRCFHSLLYTLNSCTFSQLAMYLKFMHIEH